jgi:type I restriction enzyme S subunit
MEYGISMIGEIEKDYKIVALGQLITESDERNMTDEEIRVYTISNKYGFVQSEEFFKKIVYSKNLSKYKLVKKDYFAYNPHRVNVGSIALNNGTTGLVSPAYVVFKVKDRTKILPRFLYYLLTSREYKHLIKRYSNVKGGFRFDLAFSYLCKFPIPLLPFSEQQKVIEILHKVDEAIWKVDEVIAKTERLKKGLMQELLTKGIGHKEYKDTPIGKTPKTWQTVRLEDVSEDFIGGGTPSTSNPEYWNGDIAWMTSAHINGRLITTGQKYITKKGLENSATNLVPKNNLLVATRVGIGKAAINKIDIAISQDLTGVIIDKNKAMSEFLYWVLVNSGSRLKSLAQGSTIKGILREELGRVYIPLPSLVEQQQINEILSTVDKKLELEKNEKTRLERVKRGLMDLLLTGKVRVKVN